MLLCGFGTFSFYLPYFEMLLASVGSVRLATKTSRGLIILSVKVAALSP